MTDPNSDEFKEAVRQGVAEALKESQQTKDVGFMTGTVKVVVVIVVIILILLAGALFYSWVYQQGMP